VLIKVPSSHWETHESWGASGCSYP